MNDAISVDYITNILNDYDGMLLKYEKYILSEHFNIDKEAGTVTYTNNKLETIKEFKYSILGITYDNVWTWGWVYPNIDEKNTMIAKEILLYSLSLYHSNSNILQLCIKAHCVNSRFRLKNKINLDIHLAIIYNICKKIKFIHKLPIPDSHGMNINWYIAVL